MIDGEKHMDTETILIVDDVETNRAILEEIIKDMGCVPILAEGGEQALQLVRQKRPQLILTDISMPGMDGYELCRLLKADEKTREIPIIFISAFDDPMDIVEGFLRGGGDYITKPFIPEVVQARVGVHLRLYTASRELKEMNRRLQVSVGEQLKQMEQEKKNVLYALANIAAHNSSYDKDFRDRLSRNCRILAQGMQFSPLFEDKVSDDFIETIGLAAPLCDIGNIGIPMDILKKEAWTPEEEQMIRSHTEIGAKLLKDLYVSSDYNDFISISIDIAHYHHENWDGGGYPEGRSREEIPLAAQIVSIMERYCRLTASKEADRKEALAAMEPEAGVRFNPDIYRICCKISRQLC